MATASTTATSSAAKASEASRERVGDQLAHREVGPQRDAEVTGEESAERVPELHEDRLVEPVVRDDPRDLLLGEPVLGVAQRARDRVARQHADHDEREHVGEEHDHDRLAGAAQGVGTEVRSTGASSSVSDGPWCVCAPGRDRAHTRGDFASQAAGSSRRRGRCRTRPSARGLHVDALDDLRDRDEVALLEHVLLQLVDDLRARFAVGGGGDRGGELVELLVARADLEPVSRRCSGSSGRRRRCRRRRSCG